MPRRRRKPFEFKGHLKEASTLDYMRLQILVVTPVVRSIPTGWREGLVWVWLMAGAVRVTVKVGGGGCSRTSKALTVNFRPRPAPFLLKKVGTPSGYSYAPQTQHDTLHRSLGVISP